MNLNVFALGRRLFGNGKLGMRRAGESSEGFSLWGFYQRCRCAEYLVNKRSMLGEDTVDFWFSVAHFTGKNHTVLAGPYALEPREFAFQGLDIARFPLKSSQRETELFSWFRGKLSEELHHLRGEVYRGHASRAAMGKNFVRPFL